MVDLQLLYLLDRLQVFSLEDALIWATRHMSLV